MTAVSYLRRAGILLSIAALLGLGAAGMARTVETPLAYARLGQTVRVNGPSVTPLAVREDSRCPSDVACVWAGEVRLSVRVVTGRGAQRMELTLGRPVRVADGMLMLASVTPKRVSRTNTANGRYYFGFHFVGGI